MKKYLIVVDMQNDFISGSLGTNKAKEIVPNVLNKILEYPKENILVLQDTHNENYLDTQEGKKLPVLHCIKGTFGHEIVEELKKPLEGAKLFEKEIFGSVELVEYLAMEFKKEPFEVEIVGLCTDICVVSNAIMLRVHIPELKIKVDQNCSAGVTEESHQAALTTMRMCQIEIN